MADISQCSWKRYQRRSSNIQFHTSWPQQLAFPDDLTERGKEDQKAKKKRQIVRYLQMPADGKQVVCQGKPLIHPEE